MGVRNGFAAVYRTGVFYGGDVAVEIKFVIGNHFDLKDMINKDSFEEGTDIKSGSGGNAAIGGKRIKDEGINIIRVIVGEECGNGEE